MYSLKTGEYKTKRVKEVKKSVVREKIRHEDYKKTLEQQARTLTKMRTIRADKYQVSSCELTKIDLSCYDDKRYITEDRKTGLAFGNLAIAKQCH